MNAQRWLALGVVALLIACVASNSLWLPLIQERGGDGGNATPTMLFPATQTAVPAFTPSPDVMAEAVVREGDSTITPDPFIAQMMEELALTPMSDEPYIIMAGDFTVIDAMHRGEGTASVYQIGETRRVLRLEPFTVTTGPDLHVLLSPHPSPRTSSEALLPTFVDLGVLQNTIGAQNYEIPPEVDLQEGFKSVVVYSMSFNVIYSTATLEKVRGER